MIDPAVTLFRIRLGLSVFILGLVTSGLTAFPLLTELNLLARWLGVNAAQPAASAAAEPGSLAAWIVQVDEGLRVTYARYPFVAYGTDWLAFAHLIIALFFIGPLVDPVRNIFVLYAGLWACALVCPLALICGPLRGVPFGWRLIDCSFGAVGFLVLLYVLKHTKRLAAASYTRFIIPSGGR